MKWYEDWKERWQYAATTRTFKKGTTAEVKELQFQMVFLIKEGQQKHMDYLDNVQSPFLDIEKQMVKDHKHEYQEYMKLMKENDKYSFKDIYVLRGDGGKLTNGEYDFYMYNIQSPYLKIERKMVKEHKHEYPEYIALKELAIDYQKYSDENTAKRKAIKKRIDELWD